MGKVYLVGAGPGDPELLSLKAYRLIKEADVILVDNLVLGVKELIPPGKKVIDTGKTSKKHKFSQDEINELMVHLSARYDKVVRLKGGDPFIFGRGGEEAVYLKEHGIEFEVVPGITSAIAVPASFSIPLSYRGVSSSITIITGHEMEEKEENLNWNAIANLKGTLVILMGVGNLATNVALLLKHGLRSDVPVAVIEKGFTPDARIVTGTLDNIVTVARSEGVKPPAVIVVGDVVRIREKLSEL
ncbi:MAG: uroporphyrinogen-III C-methyltransferase [Methanophagales archaeon]|nr:uroporphyrinogen-III C-methyltransferase [Methanophagales archaeon]MCW3138236.1 uroporphyrinogen-III C-methyltransferase [Methanophagales archaeon]MCW3140263.1 uroporphyrinogen-III C-methyltransferase [Methanophagales archaeon]MCW7070662.1 uroporphyrinogen-III C-methyltransferase [Methanophagales archaeon]MCW7072602.1 uroporphyrinogen-III C-methyltransferase [Methanophagales archaeon]